MDTEFFPGQGHIIISVFMQSFVVYIGLRCPILPRAAQ